MATTKELSSQVELLKSEVAQLREELAQTQARCIAALDAMQPALVAAFETTLQTMRVRPQVAPRPVMEPSDIVARSAAISRLAERFPDRRSFTSIEVMDEMSSHA